MSVISKPNDTWSNSTKSLLLFSLDICAQFDLSKTESDKFFFQKLKYKKYIKIKVETKWQKK